MRTLNTVSLALLLVVLAACRSAKAVLSAQQLNALADTAAVSVSSGYLNTEFCAVGVLCDTLRLGTASGSLPFLVNWQLKRTHVVRDDAVHSVHLNSFVSDSTVSHINASKAVPRSLSVLPWAVAAFLLALLLLVKYGR